MDSVHEQLNTNSTANSNTNSSSSSLPTFETAQDSDHIRQLRQLYEDFNEENARTFFSEYLKPSEIDYERDIIIIHDPQPAGMIKCIRQHHPRLLCIWRCHVGVDLENNSTRAAWSFLDQYIQSFDSLVFSSPLYVPSSVKHKSSIIRPGIAPLAPKNKELSPYEIIQVLLQAGIMQTSNFEHGCELIDPLFEFRVKIYKAPGEPVTSCLDARKSTNVSTTATEEQSSSNVTDQQTYLPVTVSSTSLPSPRSLPCLLPLVLEGIPFLHRPVVTQISRWDRLKGWKGLMLGWADLKINSKVYLEETSLMTPSSNNFHDVGRHRKLIECGLLILAGPDPAFIHDDPEGLETLDELKQIYNTLPTTVQNDIKIIELPMNNVVENALIVNSIQRSSLIVVQNSIREGYGLTISEAKFKKIATISTEQSVGGRTQIEHGIDGILVSGNPNEPRNVARAINTLLGNDLLREEISVNGQRSATETSLIYTQMESWLKLVMDLIHQRKVIRQDKAVEGTDESQGHH